MAVTETFTKAGTIPFLMVSVLGVPGCPAHGPFCKAWCTHVIKTGSLKTFNKDCLHPKRKGCGSPGARKTQLLLVSKDFLQRLQKKKCSYTKQH